MVFVFTHTMPGEGGVRGWVVGVFDEVLLAEDEGAGDLAGAGGGVEGVLAAEGAGVPGLLLLGVGGALGLPAVAGGGVGAGVEAVFDLLPFPDFEVELLAVDDLLGVDELLEAAGVDAAAPLAFLLFEVLLLDEDDDACVL